mgnify:CR=1 FL=1
MVNSTRPLISDHDADLLAGALRRRTLMGAAAAAGGVLAMPLSGFAQTTGGKPKSRSIRRVPPPFPSSFPILAAGWASRSPKC